MNIHMMYIAMMVYVDHHGTSLFPMKVVAILLLKALVHAKRYSRLPVYNNADKEIGDLTCEGDGIAGWLRRPM